MADWSLERALRARGFCRVAGVDEAGRGPLAGPVVAAAVILPERWEAAAPLDDSKALAPEVRERAFAAILRHAVAWRAAVVGPEEIDRINILQATLAGMARAVARLRPGAEYALVDGNRLPALACPAEALVKGDARSASVAAASIVAKVVRDRLMAVYGRRFPQWDFARHKGYPTTAHLRALAVHGASPIHRRSFRPVAACLGGEGQPWRKGSDSAHSGRPLPRAI